MIDTTLAVLRSNLRRWRDLYPGWIKAATRANAWRAAHKRLPSDIRVDPANAEERLTRVQREAGSILRVEWPIMEEYLALEKEIKDQLAVVAKVAEEAGLNSAPLSLFAQDLDPRHFEAAQEIAERVGVIGVGEREHNEAPTKSASRSAATAGALSKGSDQQGAPRLTLDSLSQSVTLDGRQFVIEVPRVFLLYQRIADLHGQPITRAELRAQMPGLKGDKTIPRLLDQLTFELRQTIRSGSSGYWLQLAVKK